MPFADRGLRAMAAISLLALGACSQSRPLPESREASGSAEVPGGDASGDATNAAPTASSPASASGGEAGSGSGDRDVGETDLAASSTPPPEREASSDSEGVPPGSADGEGAGAETDDPPVRDAQSGGLSPELIEAYCDMEARCIPGCVGDDGTIPCASDERQATCRRDARTWLGAWQGEACPATGSAWVECIVGVDCRDAYRFFRAHPDDVLDDTPCAAEYFALECQDFEPLTEYSWPLT